MRCSTCGCLLQEATTDLPFKIGDTTIVVVRGVPVLQCPNCPDFLIADHAMARIESLLENRNRGSELEVVRFAA